MNQPDFERHMREVRAAIRADATERLAMFILSVAVVLLVIVPLATTVQHLLAQLRLLP